MTDKRGDKMGQTVQRMTGWLFGQYTETSQSTGITENDVLEASYKIAAAKTKLNVFARQEGKGELIGQESGRGSVMRGRFHSGYESGDRSMVRRDLTRKNVGSRFNEWRYPITEYGKNHPEWEAKLKNSQYIGEIDIGKEKWDEGRKIIDLFLGLLVKEITSVAEVHGLQIKSYVRQGSSREGLKVIAPDEFDTLLLYHIDGISFRKENIDTACNKRIPEYCKLICSDNVDHLKAKFPKLFTKGVFKQEFVGGPVHVSSKALNHVFQSIIDQSRDTIDKFSNKWEERGTQIAFRTSRIINPPSINLTVKVMTSQENGFDDEIDLDVVPGVVLQQDQVSDPANSGHTMDCPVYAVFKWVENSSLKASKFNDTNVWRVCSSGYEKHSADIASCSKQQRYILTALRILKAYFSKTKSFKKGPTPQIVTVLRSYHLKHIAHYVILFTQYLEPRVVLIGVLEALNFFFCFLRVSLERKCLPHFFHSNKYITHIFPNYPVTRNALRFNLLGQKSNDALNQALLALENHLIPNVGFKQDHIDPVMEHIVSLYDQFISEGDYF